MTRLLVSVRSAEEAEAALVGADVIDVKEPRWGALGPASPEVWSEIQDAVGDQAVTSVALGELLHDPVESLASRAARFSFAKIGLAGCHASQGWISRLRRVVQNLPLETSLVPVAYADWPRAEAPSPCVALWLAQQTSAKLLLIDTWDKRAGALPDILSWQSLSEISRCARQAGVRLALAGSLNEEAIARLLPLAPAYIGVRGAACRGGREGTIDRELVKSLAKLVHAVRQKAAS